MSKTKAMQTSFGPKQTHLTKNKKRTGVGFILKLLNKYQNKQRRISIITATSRHKFTKSSNNMKVSSKVSRQMNS